MSRNVAAAAGTAQPVQANKNTTYLYTAGRCFILLDPHRPGWLPWRQGKTPLWGRWSLGTQREWSASPPHKHTWPPGTWHHPPPPQLCCPSANPPPRMLSPPLRRLQNPRAPMAPTPLPLLSPMEANAGNVPMELGSARNFFPLEPGSKHQAPHFGFWDSNPVQSHLQPNPAGCKSLRVPRRCTSTGCMAQGPGPGWHREGALLPSLLPCVGPAPGSLHLDRAWI